MLVSPSIFTEVTHLWPASFSVCAEGLSDTPVADNLSPVFGLAGCSEFVGPGQCESMPHLWWWFWFSQMCSCCTHWHSWAHIHLVVLGTAIVGHRFELQFHWAPQFPCGSGETDRKTLGIWLLWKLEQETTTCEAETSSNLCASTFSVFSGVGTLAVTLVHGGWVRKGSNVKTQDLCSPFLHPLFCKPSGFWESVGEDKLSMFEYLR